jgi:hypothetical protein
MDGQPFPGLTDQTHQQVLPAGDYGLNRPTAKVQGGETGREEI